MRDHPTWPHADPAPSAVGPDVRIAGRYRIVAPLASGGMAQVWRAVDEVLDRPVAVKVLHPHLAADPDFVARFRREAVAAARLAHSGIVAIYDTCDDPEAIVMELVEGRTLRAELDQRGFLPTAEALAIAAGVAEALEAAHRAGIVHRDVKPANVLLTADGHVKVTDFGIAKAARVDPDLPDLTRHGQLVGTAKYLAPEQVEGGPVDARTDVYALGVALYEMLCGRPPFDGANDQAVAVARLKTPPVRPRSVLRTIPGVVDQVVMRALAIDPDQRFRSAAAMRAALLAAPTADDDVVVEELDDTAVGEAVSFARTERSWLVPSLLVVLVAASLGVAWLLIGGREVRDDLLDLVDRVRPGPDADADEPAALPVAVRPVAFDPFGGDGEHDEDAPLAADGDTTTAWRTERYNSRSFGDLKPGVGLRLDLSEVRELEQLTVASTANDWAFAVYASEGTPPTLEAWGDPVVDRSDVPSGTTRIDLDGRRAGSLLLWITDLGDGPGVRVEIAEVTATAR